MRLVQLVHWKEEEHAARLNKLRAAGYRAVAVPVTGPEALKELGRGRPAAIVIDLDRLPSHGREVGMLLRQKKATRRIPVVFVGGEKPKVEKIRQLLPDAGYCSWRGVAGALRRVIGQPPAEPAVPAPMAGYSGTPLPRKLGIKEGTRMVAINAPANFAAILGELPEGAAVRRGARASGDLVIVFVATLRALRQAIATLTARRDESPAWIAWPKRTSPLAADVSERDVRAQGLAAGMVDYKICAIDSDWSGLLFSRKKKGVS